MKYSEHPVLFDCAGERLVGVLARPETPASVGLVVIVGGPQYRAGSHRQFVLLARRLAEEGFPTFRFDYRGMGDSTGDIRSFETIDEDIARAIDVFVAAEPSVRSVVLWGLCDGASAAMMYAADDSRIGGVVLLNPWARAEATYAKAQLRHYYLRRLMSRSFWCKLLAGDVQVRESAGSLASLIATAARPANRQGDYRDRMLAGLKRFRGRALLVLSGQDLTAKEFIDFSTRNGDWTAVLSAPKVEQLTLADADHTFSISNARSEVERASLTFVAQRVG